MEEKKQMSPITTLWFTYIPFFVLGIAIIFIGAGTGKEPAYLAGLGGGLLLILGGIPFAIYNYFRAKHRTRKPRNKDISYRTKQMKD